MDWGSGLMGFKRLEVLMRDEYDVVEILVKMICGKISRMIIRVYFGMRLGLSRFPQGLDQDRSARPTIKSELDQTPLSWSIVVVNL